MSISSESLKKIALLLILYIAALYISNQIIYELLILPRLSKQLSIPFVYWIITFLPIILASVYTGYILNKFNLILFFCLAAAVVDSIFDILAVFTKQPGFINVDLNSNYIIFNFIVTYITVFCFVVLGWIINKIRNKSFRSGAN